MRIWGLNFTRPFLKDIRVANVEKCEFEDERIKWGGKKKSDAKEENAGELIVSG